MLKRLICIFFVTAAALASEISDQQIGYTITLPENWVKEVVSDTNHRFLDTTATYTAVIGIVRYDFSSDTLFSSAEEWTRANFIGYSFVIDADPFSLMLFYDTVTAGQNGSLWAADAYSVTFSTDTQIFDWGEYVRFTAVGTTGFELYVIGELDDMNTNVAFYRSIIDNITITLETPVLFSRPAVFSSVHGKKINTAYRINLLGRHIGNRLNKRASQIIVDKNDRIDIIR